jgi:NAD(P)-dependent dehydrogenase (short-subunit alcohol dehydrogenase family)
MTTAAPQKWRAAAVTGAGGGLGREIALGFATKGYRVFRIARKPEEIAEVEQASGGAVVLTICDVTDESAVQSWAKQVSEALGDDGLDVLVNNAGILTPGPLELLPLDAIKHEFDVNVFGSLAVIHAFLPALRKARGRILPAARWTSRRPTSSGSKTISWPSTGTRSTTSACTTPSDSCLTISRTSTPLEVGEERDQ